MRVILSISSDIGTSVALNWIESGCSVIGTYRTWSSNCELLESKGALLVECDLLSPRSLDEAIAKICKLDAWEVMLIAPGDQRPIGLFEQTDFQEWENSIDVNFVRPLEFLRKILHRRKSESGFISSVLLFAGGGTNSATSNYSAYTISKIASIKMCELLDHEIRDCKFTIIGPGWIETKIHDATIEAGALAGENLERTIKMRSENLMNPVSIVVDACNWAIKKSKEIVGGRNFSAVHDDFDSEFLEMELVKNPNFFKLRREGNGIYDR